MSVVMLGGLFWARRRQLQPILADFVQPTNVIATDYSDKGHTPVHSTCFPTAEVVGECSVVFANRFYSSVCTNSGSAGDAVGTSIVGLFISPFLEVPETHFQSPQTS